MQCNCGGMTAQRVATHRGTDLLYECCAGCGRCGQWLLMRAGAVLAQGEQARQEFEADKCEVSA